MRDSWFEWETILMGVMGLSMALIFVFHSWVLIFISLLAIVAGLILLVLYAPPETGL